MFVTIDSECAKIISLSDYIYKYTLNNKRNTKINNYVVHQLVLYMENIHIKNIVDLMDRFEFFTVIFKYTLKISYYLYSSQNNVSTLKVKAEIFSNQNCADWSKIFEIKFSPIEFDPNKLYYNLKELKESLINLKNEKIKDYS